MIMKTGNTTVNLGVLDLEELPRDYTYYFQRMDGILAITDIVDGVNDEDSEITASNQFIKLPNITANRTLTLPDAGRFFGTQIKIWNLNTSLYTWSFAANVVDASNTAFTIALTSNKIYQLESDGISWVIIN